MSEEEERRRQVRERLRTLIFVLQRSGDTQTTQECVFFSIWLPFPKSVGNWHNEEFEGHSQAEDFTLNQNDVQLLVQS